MVDKLCEYHERFNQLRQVQQKQLFQQFTDWVTKNIAK
jgi:hypothetical protein